MFFSFDILNYEHLSGYEPKFESFAKIWFYFEVQFIKKHYQQSITSLTFISAYHIHHACREHTNDTLSEFLKMEKEIPNFF